jgi:hypothetical protein
MQTPEELYEETHNRFGPDNILSDDEMKTLHSHMKDVYLRLAMVPYTKSSPYRNRVMQEFADKTTDAGLFPVEVSEKEHLQGADLVLGNHQGPSDGIGKGGFESLLVWAGMPPNTSVVMKHELLQFRWSIKEAIQSIVYNRANPIPFVRPEGEGAQYGKGLVNECRRVSKEVARTITEDDMTVLMYPEGQRSPNGKVLQFKPALLHGIVENYIEPAITEGETPRIALAVSDTLSTMPNGYGKKAPIYKFPYKIEGIPFDPGGLVAAVQEGESTRKVTNMLATDARRSVEEKLFSMIQHTLSNTP